MSETFGPFSSGSGATFTDTQWQALMSSIMRDGVIVGVLNELAVSPGSGMQVLVNTGQAIVHGIWYQNDASKALTIAAADPTNPRIDLVVLHADLVAKTIAAQVTTGTPAPSPSEPSITQSSTVWEVRVATMTVPAGATSISSGNIGVSIAGPSWATPNIRYASDILTKGFFFQTLSNNVDMFPSRIVPGGAGGPTKSYPLDNGASTAAMDGTEWHLQGKHNGSVVDMIEMISGTGGAAAKLILKNMSVFTGTGNGTFNHNLGQTPDVVIVSPTTNNGESASVDAIGSTTCRVTLSGPSVPWVGIAIKNS